MQPTPPQWPDQSTPMPAVKPPQSRSTRVFGAVAIVSVVLIVALIGTLILILARSNQSGPSTGELQAGTPTTSELVTQGTVQATTTGTNGTPVPTTSSSHSAPTATPAPVKPSVHQVSNQATLSGTSTGPVNASCPSGELALSGSWRLSGDPTAAPIDSFRNGSRGWSVYVTHASDVTVKVYVECLRHAPGATVGEISHPLVVPASSTASAIATCLAGQVVVGGGFEVPMGDETYTLVSHSASEWLAIFSNHSARDANFTAFAECLTYPNAQSTRPVLTQISIPQGTSNQVTSSPCPSGQFASGGGFIYDKNADVYFMEASNNNTTWTVGLNANNGQDETLKAYVECIGI